MWWGDHSITPENLISLGKKMWWGPLSLAKHKAQNKTQGAWHMIYINKQPQAPIPEPTIVVSIPIDKLSEYLDKVRSQ